MKPRLPNEVDREDTPDPPVVDYLNRLRDDLLERLCWDVFGSLNDILIKDPENSLTVVSKPPLSNILVYIDVCEEKHNIDEHEEEDRYAALELIIDKEDGSPIFLHDFVSQVHSYLNANKEEIMQCEDELYMNPWTWATVSKRRKSSLTMMTGTGQMDLERTQIESFFDRAMFNQIYQDEYSIHVVLFVEGNNGETLDSFWERKNRP
ncbi:hypothetical protein J3E71DRAFT_395070 [Bipolaris maydis]|nr:hypothetical protein J3E71DRAFT_395070 [Bipolaris maydis]